MKAFGITLLLASAVFLFGWFVVRPWLASGSSSVVVGPVNYLCTETKEMFELPAQPEPAANPKTGRRTLVRAVRTADGKSWVAAPPDEVLRRERQGRPKPQSAPVPAAVQDSPDD